MNHDILTAPSEPQEKLTEQAFRRIHLGILSGQLRPGAPVTEVDLMEQFELTRAPVRHAIARLGHEGWLVAQSKRRYVVKPITLRDVREVFDLRKQLEPEAALRAAGRVNEARLAQFDEIMSQTYDPNDAESETRFFAANSALHCSIAEAAGNQRITQIVKKLHDESERILRVGMRYINWSHNWQHGHEELISALVSGQGELAAQIALRQINQSERIVMDAMTELLDEISFGLGPDVRNTKV
ncbi:GntR family transcriptional regulator [Microvirga rosea]|uniref:GntR family transcriptional regulator n=1 Tax=Microvirga rosea TaxID=2715425 RepID=UPI001D09F1F4|nr:GntR family transcriptional regulator [Microvirga rosea]MCB8823198.1 GntR family transcriptional regulator [Microvirga rosea]